MNSSFYNKGNHIKSWDSLRLLFMLSIITVHVGNYFVETDRGFLGFIYSMGGYFGNYFFFLLSGILISMTHRNRISGGNESFSQFLKTRLKTIYPVFLLGEFLAIFYRVINSGWESLSVGHVFADLFLITSGWWTDRTPYDLAAWFLCILVICYILYFFIAHVYQKNKLIYCGILFFMVILGLCLIQGDWKIPLLFRINGEGYMNFFLGCLLYEGYSFLYEKTNVQDKTFVISGGIALILLIVAACIDRGYLLEYKISISVICALIILLAVKANPVRCLLELRPLPFLGSVSMELFLLHLPLYNLYKMAEPQFLKDQIPGEIQWILFLIVLFVVCIMVKYLENILESSFGKKTNDQLGR